MKSRKQFIESNGATCDNWIWSWSFINDRDRVVIFGMWDIYEQGDLGLIFSEAWKISAKGKKQPGYDQSLRHIIKIEQENYRLKTFSMIHSDEKKDDSGVGPAAIKGFTPKLIDKALLRIGSSWYARSLDAAPTLGDDLPVNSTYLEGATKQILVNAYERSIEARKACVEHYGHKCCVCQFDFEKVYGELGRHYIHVHHLIPLAETCGEYVLDPIKDLVPLCPNCHAIVHRTRPALTLQQLKACLHRTDA